MTLVEQRALHRWQARFYKLAERYGVEDIEPNEIAYAHKARERGDTAEQAAAELWRFIAISQCDTD